MRIGEVVQRFTVLPFPTSATHGLFFASARVSVLEVLQYPLRPSGVNITSLGHSQQCLDYIRCFRRQLTTFSLSQFSGVSAQPHGGLLDGTARFIHSLTYAYVFLHATAAYAKVYIQRYTTDSERHHSFTVCMSWNNNKLLRL